MKKKIEELVDKVKNFADTDSTVRLRFQEAIAKEEEEHLRKIVAIKDGFKDQVEMLTKERKVVEKDLELHAGKMSKGNYIEKSDLSKEYRDFLYGFFRALHYKRTHDGNTDEGFLLGSRKDSARYFTVTLTKEGFLFDMRIIDPVTYEATITWPIESLLHCSSTWMIATGTETSENDGMGPYSVSGGTHAMAQKTIFEQFSELFEEFLHKK